MNEQTYYIARQGQKVGPLTYSDIVALKSGEDELIWKDGLVDWIQLGKLPEFVNAQTVKGPPEIPAGYVHLGAGTTAPTERGPAQTEVAVNSLERATRIKRKFATIVTNYFKYLKGKTWVLVYTWLALTTAFSIKGMRAYLLMSRAPKRSYSDGHDYTDMTDEVKSLLGNVPTKEIRYSYNDTSTRIDNSAIDDILTEYVVNIFTFNPLFALLTVLGIVVIITIIAVAIKSFRSIQNWFLDNAISNHNSTSSP